MCSKWNRIEAIVTEIFNGIDETTVEKILKTGKKITVGKDAEIYKQGYIGIIESGAANVKRTGKGGATLTVRTMISGDIFGAVSVFGDWGNNFSSITTKTDTTIYYFSEKDLVELLNKYPQFALNYITFLTDRIRFLNRRLDTFCAGETQNKLYEYLISHADNNGVIVFDINMAELARRLNIGRTSLYRDISLLEEAGLIKRVGKKFLLNKGD